MNASYAALWRVASATRRRRRFGIAVALGAGAVLSAAALLATSGYLISRAAERPPILSLTVAVVAVRGLSLARAALRYGERVASHDLALRVLADLRVRFFGRLAPLVPGGLPLRAADLLDRYVADVEALQHLYLRVLGPPVIAAVTVTATVLAAGWMLPAAALALAGVLALAAVVPPLVTTAVARAAVHRQAPARSALAIRLVELATAGPELAVAGRRAEWVRRIAADDAALLRAQRRDAIAGSLTAGFSALLTTGAAVAVVAVALPSVHDGTLAGTALAALALLALGSLEGVAPLATAARHVDGTATAAARLEEITSVGPPTPDAAQPTPVPASGDLEIHGVSVRGILDDVSLRLPAGRRVALVGPSGAGKTTLARLLVRFRDPDDGSVTLGGVDLRRLRQAELRRTVRLAGQDAHLFATSIDLNLRLARPDATADELRAALDAVGLGPWLDTLAGGTDTAVGRHGTELSGGQRRRMAAARLLLADARFLIFDEPAAHLHPAAAERLQRSLPAAAGDRGLLLITHTLAGLDGFDEVLVLEGGRITGRGVGAQQQRIRRPARPEIHL
jgi:ATP-binding cassette, subfamily C, bacterial CydC